MTLDEARAQMFDAQSRLSFLVPTLGQDGTLGHAVKLIEEEFAKLREELTIERAMRAAFEGAAADLAVARTAEVKALRKVINIQARASGTIPCPHGKRDPRSCTRCWAKTPHPTTTEGQQP